MPLDASNLYQNLIAAAIDATSELKYQNTFLQNIFWDNHPITVAPNTQLQVHIPDVQEGDVADIGAGAIRPTGLSERGVPIKLERNFSTSYVIPEWMYGRTPRKLRDEFVSPRIEALARAINHTIADLVNPTNFNVYPLINGASDDKFDRGDITAAWANLAETGVPVSERGKMFFTTSSKAYGAMLGDSNFITESIVAVNAAEAAQQRAELVNAYGAKVAYDQHLKPWNAGKQPGAFFHKYAIAGLNALPPAKLSGSAIEETFLNLAGPDTPVFRMQIWESPDKQGVTVHMNCWWGVAVARPEMGALLQTA